MKVVKSRQFEGAYIIKELSYEKSQRTNMLEHLFLKDAKEVDGKMNVPYVFYSRHYRKWYEDIIYMPKERFEDISSKIKNF